MTPATGLARIAVDIGGTFTDVALEVGERRTTVKILTTPSAPEIGVLEGIRAVLGDAGVAPSDVGLVIHGTTLATNAMIERKGARTALITTRGFRDVLEIGYETRFDQYDLMLEKLAPLVPREWRFTVEERIDVRGRVLTPLDEAGVQALVPALAGEDIQSVAVGFIHAYANPAHEQRAGEILADALPHLWLTLSSEVCPEIREYERFTTASANAYVRPLMASYLGRLQDRLEQLGLGCPLLLMTSGGGLTTLATAMRFPIRLVESGPAGGAILASRIAAELALDKVVSFDMGGTTAKICLIERFEPQTAREFEVGRSARFIKGSGLPLRIPVIEMVEIGAGGGSIARVDAMRRIAIGPDSAGADPGPAAYGRGGTQPTITDADLALGRIDPAGFAGGKVALDPGRAEDAIAAAVAGPLGLDGWVAAFGIAEMVDETMANAARVHAVEHGKSVAEHSLVAFGGAAPLHVARVAKKLGIRRIVIPVDAGVGSAVGFLRAPVAYEIVRSRQMRLGPFDAVAINALLEEMRAEALAVVRAGAPDAALTEQRVAYMRYCGQGHEIVVPLPDGGLAPGDGPRLQKAFDAEYRKLYRRTIPSADVEALSWGLTISAAGEVAQLAVELDALEPPAPAGHRRLFDAASGEWLEVPLYRRRGLAPGTRLRGPALITEEQTSTYVSGSFDARIAAGGAIVLETKPELVP
jgi:N-methylhydantoinase A